MARYFFRFFTENNTVERHSKVFLMVGLIRRAALRIVLHVRLIRRAALRIVLHVRLIRRAALRIVLHVRLIRRAALRIVLHVRLIRRAALRIVLHVRLIRRANSQRISGPAGLSSRNHPLDIEPYDHEMTPLGNYGPFSRVRQIPCPAARGNQNSCQGN